MKKTEKICDCIIDSQHGIYIPKIFAQRYGDLIRQNTPHIDGDVLGDLLEGPSAEFYWESWEEVLDNFNMMDQTGSGKKLVLYQDNDLFLVEEDWQPDND